MPHKDPEIRKAYSKEYHRKRYLRYKESIITKGMERESRRRRHLNRYKKLKGCSHCGYDKNPIALDFHHVDKNDKRKGVAGMLSHSRRKIFDEIRKCIILCANCHRIEHSK